MKRKIRSVLLGVVAIFALMVSAQATFSDVDESARFADAVKYVSSQGIIEGYSDGTFKPNNIVTRAQMSAMLCRMMGCDNNISTNGKRFFDVPDDYWANGYITTAASLGVINGFSDGTFRPNHILEYNQAVALLLRAFGMRDEAERAGGYPNGYLTVAQNRGLLNGISAPKGKPLSRADIAVVMYNFASMDGRPVVPDSPDVPDMPVAPDVPDIPNESDKNTPDVSEFTIPKALCQQSTSIPVKEYLPRVTFYPDRRCEVIINWVDEMVTALGSYEMYTYSSGTRMIACTAGSELEPLHFYLMETGGNRWVYKGPQLGFTASGDVFTPITSDTVQVGQVEVDDSDYLDFTGYWNGVAEGSWPVTLHIRSIQNGVISFDFSLYRGWGDDLTAVLGPNGVAYGWNANGSEPSDALLKLSFRNELVCLEFYDINPYSVYAENFPDQYMNGITMVLDKRGVY